MPARTLDLSADAWTRLDNLARRLARPLDQVLADFAGRSELLNQVADALSAPIVPSNLPLRCTPGNGATEIAPITVRGKLISTRLRYRDETFVDVVRRLKFKWDGETWLRVVDKFGEPLADRVVELGVHLLAAGIQSSAIVEMMVLGILPKVDLAVFSDLEDEPAYVYQQLECLEGRLEQIGGLLVRLHACSAATPGSIVGKLLSETTYMSIPAYTHLDGKRPAAPGDAVAHARSFSRCG